MHVSIVIPAYNAAATLGECLAACKAQSHPDVEIVVADDGSTDATPAIAREHGVRYLRQENLGPAAARNLGARAASGDIVAFTDSDCVPHPDWIAKLLEGFLDDHTVGVGGAYGIRDDANLMARIVHEEIVLRHARFRSRVDFLGSFNVAYRRAAFDEVGGFDESFRYASAEDNDLAYRLHDAGGILRFASEARVTHFHPTRLLPYLRTQMRHGYWRMKLYAKHPRRSGGDHYAGAGDLLGPPAALALLCGLALWPLVGGAAYGLGLAAIGLGYLAATAGILGKMIRRLGASAGLTYRAMTVLRDVARGLGLIGGVWTFFVLRRGAAG